MCNDQKVINQGKKSVECPYCGSSDRLMVSLRKAISDARKEGKAELSTKLSMVLNFLPEHSVMAMAEAQALDLPENFVIMIQDSFGVRPFMDVEYHKEGITVK